MVWWRTRETVWSRGLRSAFGLVAPWLIRHILRKIDLVSRETDGGLSCVDQRRARSSWQRPLICPGRRQGLLFLFSPSFFFTPSFSLVAHSVSTAFCCASLTIHERNYIINVEKFSHACHLPYHQPISKDLPEHLVNWKFNLASGIISDYSKVYPNKYTGPPLTVEVCINSLIPASKYGCCIGFKCTHYLAWRCV